MFYTNKEVKDVNELKVRSFAWRKAGTIHVGSSGSAAARAALELTVPLTCSALKLAYTSFFEDAHSQASETLICPSCNQARVAKSPYDPSHRSWLSTRFQLFFL